MLHLSQSRRPLQDMVYFSLIRANQIKYHDKSEKNVRHHFSYPLITTGEKLQLPNQPLIVGGPSQLTLGHHGFMCATDLHISTPEYGRHSIRCTPASPELQVYKQPQPAIVVPAPVAAPATAAPFSLVHDKTPLLPKFALPWNQF